MRSSPLPSSCTLPAWGTWLALLLTACGSGSLSNTDGPPPGQRNDGGLRLLDGSPGDATVPRDATSPGSDAGPDAADAASPPPRDASAEGSGGTGGAYPGPQRRTVEAGGTSFTYELYVPSSYRPDTPMPLLCLFHGQGGSGANIRDFWQPSAERGGFLLLATNSSGSSGGWAPGRDAPRFEAALNDALAAYAVDTRRLYVWGFSAGAHFVHAIALLNPDLFAAYAVNAGVLAALADSTAPTEAARIRRIPVEIRVGRGDPLFPQAEQDRTAFLNAGWREGDDLRFTAFDGGHALRRGDPDEIWAFLRAFRLP